MGGICKARLTSAAMGAILFEMEATQDAGTQAPQRPMDVPGHRRGLTSAGPRILHPLRPYTGAPDQDWDEYFALRDWEREHN